MTGVNFDTSAFSTLGSVGPPDVANDEFAFPTSDRLFVETADGAPTANLNVPELDNTQGGGQIDQARGSTRPLLLSGESPITRTRSVTEEIKFVSSDHSKNLAQVGDRMQVTIHQSTDTAGNPSFFMKAGSTTYTFREQPKDLNEAEDMARQYIKHGAITSPHGRVNEADDPANYVTAKVKHVFQDNESLNQGNAPVHTPYKDTKKGDLMEVHVKREGGQWVMIAGTPDGKEPDWGKTYYFSKEQQERLSELVKENRIGQAYTEARNFARSYIEYGAITHTEGKVIEQPWRERLNPS